MSPSGVKYERAYKTRSIAYGGVGLMIKLAREVGLVEAIDRRLRLLKMHVPYHESATVSPSPEGTGVVRDMLQNHLLQLLCMMAMEAPLSYDVRSLRHETVKVLQAIRPLDVRRECVLGQYGAGAVAGRRVPAYCDEKGVSETSVTPTFAAIKVQLSNWRWSGVPFYLRTGKRLPCKLTEISIHFKPTPHPPCSRVMVGPGRSYDGLSRKPPECRTTPLPQASAITGL